MRQRNDSGGVLHVSAWPTQQEPDRAPFDKGPGEIVDFPEPLAGFTPLDDETPEQQEPAAKTRRGSKPQSTDNEGTEGGEPA